MTGHAETNVAVIEQFLGKKFGVEKKGNLIELTTV